MRGSLFFHATEDEPDDGNENGSEGQPHHRLPCLEVAARAIVPAALSAVAAAVTRPTAATVTLATTVLSARGTQGSPRYI